MLAKCLLRRTLCTTSRICSGYRNTQIPTDLRTNHDVRWDLKAEHLSEDLSGASNRTQKLSHPGSMSPREKIQLPKQVVDATLVLSGEYQKDLSSDAQGLVKYLHARQIPVEGEDRREAEKLVKQQLMAAAGVKGPNEFGVADTHSDEENEKNRLKVMKIEKTTRKLLNRNTYYWKPVIYDAYKSMLYLLGRFSSNYSCLCHIFYEIRKRNKEFQPSTLFDFGSGVGSTVWAANNIWRYSIGEHYCVDQSDSMNTLARLLMQGGDEDKPNLFNGVFFKQFLPPSSQRKYDLVVSGFSLLDLPNREERLNTLYNLWLKTNQFLVITELGTNEGWKIILEARDFILKLDEMKDEIGEQKKINPEELRGHVFAPCPHEMTCPRLERRDGTPCNFTTEYENLSTCMKEINDERDRYAKGRYSYVVLRKGDESTEDIAAKWPRVVREVKFRSKVATCQTCSAAGQLEYTAITKKKHGEELFAVARKPLKWGDLLPVQSFQWNNAESIYALEESGPKITKRKKGKDSILSDAVSKDFTDTGSNTTAHDTDTDSIVTNIAEKDCASVGHTPKTDTFSNCEIVKER